MEKFFTLPRLLFLMLLTPILTLGYYEQHPGMWGISKAQTIPPHDPPTLLAISPNNAHNWQDTQVLITGTNIIAIPKVRINNQPLFNVTYIDATTLTATVPSDLPSGLYTITVTNPDNQSASLPNAFTLLHSGDCTVEEWQTMTSSMNKSRSEFAVVQASNYFYALGGRETQTSPSRLASIERASIRADHTLDSWQIIGSLASPRAGHEAVVVGDYLYVLGGYDGGHPQNRVERAHIASDGNLGPWEVMESMLVGRSGFAVVRAGSYLYALGGVENNLEPSVEWTILNPDGSLAPWQPARSLSMPRHDLAALVLGGFIYVVGGQGEVFFDSVEHAAIGQDGILSSWQPVTSMSQAAYSLAAIAAQGCLYKLGGVAERIAGGFYPTNSVEQTLVDANGSVDNWRGMPTMNTERANLEALMLDGYIYVFGGRKPSGIYLNSVERTKILIDTTAPIIESFSVNGVALQTTSERVSLAISAIDSGLGVDQMRFSHDGIAWSDWQIFSPASGWELLSSDERKSVYAQVKDAANNLSLVVSDTITLETTVPADYALTIDNGAIFTNKTTVELSIGATVGTSRMMLSNDGGFSGVVWEPYTSEKAWEITAYGSYVIPRLVYIRYEDAAGNLSATYQDDIILDVTPPSGGVTIAGDATAAVANLAVRLVLTATDDVSGVADMMISGHSDFAEANWQPFQTSYLWSLDNGSIVYVRFRDNAENVSDVYFISIGGATPTSTYTPTSTVTPLPMQTPISTPTPPVVRVHIPLVSK